MNMDVFRLLVRALKSGEFESIQPLYPKPVWVNQREGLWIYSPPLRTGDRYSIRGVACELHRREFGGEWQEFGGEDLPNANPRDWHEVRTYRGEAVKIPREVQSWFGVDDVSFRLETMVVAKYCNPLFFVPWLRLISPLEPNRVLRPDFDIRWAAYVGATFEEIGTELEKVSPTIYGQRVN